MSRILLAWEMGGGYGHLVRLRSFIEPLLEEGHQVTVALHETRLASRYLDDLDIRWLPAPKAMPTTNQPLELKSFAEILLMQGFNEVEGLYGRMRCWEGIFDYVRPEVVLYDHSATAMLAFRAREVRQLAIGTGFFNPPRVTPYPLLRPWMRVGPDQLMQVEERVLEITNRALECSGIPAMDALHEMYDLDGLALLTYPELDHYEGRDTADYWGVPPNIAGDPTAWPEGDGPKVFGYLNLIKPLPSLLAELKRRRLPALIHMPAIPADLRQTYEGSNVRLTDRPVDIEQAAAEADYCICHGGHGTVANMLLAGTPLLLLPQNLEQLILAQRVEALGAAKIAIKLEPKPIKVALEDLLSRRNPVDAAARFASTHDRHTVDTFAERVLDFAEGT